MMFMHASRDVSSSHALAVATATAALALPALYILAKTIFKRKHRPKMQFTSSQFVLSAGAVTFEFVEDVPRRVLLVHYTEKNEWLLAKGRKDQGEELAAAAIREVFEETGYRCHLHRVPRLPTRAPPSIALDGLVYQPDVVRIAEDGTEPFAITIRPTGLAHVKLIFWYIGSVDMAEDQQQSAPLPVQGGSHMALEGFDGAGLFDIDDALRKLSYEGDRDLVRTALSILNSPPESE